MTPTSSPSQSRRPSWASTRRFFKSRAQFSATVYQKRLTSLLINRVWRHRMGYSNEWLNGGEFTNQGIELSSRPRRSSSGTASPGSRRRRSPATTASSTICRGSRSFHRATNFGYGADLLAPGRSVSEVVNTFKTGPSGLNVQVGDFTPGYFVSLGNEFTYKGFRVYGLLDWSRGGNTVNLTQQYFDTGPQLGADSAAAAARNTGFSNGIETYVQPASFLKVREVTVSYNLPLNLVNRIGFGRLSSARLSLSGYNLWAIFNYGGLDPEVSAFGNQAMGRGYDVTPYPPAKSYYFGLDLGL